VSPSGKQATHDGADLLKNGWQGVSLGGSTWQVYNGDALKVLEQLPDEYFHCVVTSPPYFWLRDYNVAGQI